MKRKPLKRNRKRKLLKLSLSPRNRFPSLTMKVTRRRNKNRKRLLKKNPLKSQLKKRSNPKLQSLNLKLRNKRPLRSRLKRQSKNLASL
jgi:hypothetical protein